MPVTLAKDKQPWPNALKDRATAVRAILAAFESPVGVEEVAEILEMLVALGQMGAENGNYSVG